MKITPLSCARYCCATATAEEEPPENMIAPSRSIARCAAWRAASGFVWESPLTYFTFFPSTPLPLRLSGLIVRSEEHTSELQSLMRISYAVFCLKKKKSERTRKYHNTSH